MIKLVKGDLLQSKLPLIAHQTNCLGVMGAGIARSIRNKWHNVFNQYIDYCKQLNYSRDLLGKCQICQTGYNNTKYVANLFGEYSFTESVAPFENRHTDYDALREAFISLKQQALEMGIKDIGIPSKLGCGLAGGDWNGIVYPMIQEIFNTDINLYIYQL